MYSVDGSLSSIYCVSSVGSSSRLSCFVVYLGQLLVVFGVLLLNLDLYHLSVIGFHLPNVLQILLLNLNLYHLSVIGFHLPVAYILYFSFSE